MNNRRRIFIYCSDTPDSREVEKKMRKKLATSPFAVVETIEEEPELIVCIGGDGTFLEAVHVLGFPAAPIIGVNTGHLGFFQEIMPDQIDDFMSKYLDGQYALQKMQTVKALVSHNEKTESFTGLNEIVVASSANYAYSVHFNISIGGSFIERFSGDGLLISTPAGSTAYNYSLGGSIVDPRLNLLQATPIAPMNTTAYRSFTSSILLPPDLSLGIVPDNGYGKAGIIVAFDGFSKTFEKVNSIEVKLSDKIITLLRFASYDFWNKVKSKFL